MSMPNHGSHDGEGSPPVLRRPVVVASLIFAGLAWVLLPIVFYREFPEPKVVGVLLAAVGWPVVYGFCWAMCWIAVRIWTTPESYMGPYKVMQFRMGRSVGFWWAHVLFVVFPAAIFLLSLMGLLGFLR
jgi:hypothetical protein